MDEKKEHMRKMEERLNRWGAKLDALAAKAEEAGEKVKSDYHLRVQELKSKHLAMQSKLSDLKTAEGEKWDDFKVGVEKSWNEFEGAFRKLTN